MDLEFVDYPILTKERLELTKEYAKRHYNINTYYMHKPTMIILHYSALSSIDLTLYAFKPSVLPFHRTKLTTHGLVNVGVHFVIDYNGTIYKLLPITVMGRHAVGYNHLSIGIENVGTNHKELTEEQINANVKLIYYLTQKYPSIEFLFGHLEYMNIRYPHYKYYTAYDKTYEPPIKIDPGWDFMRVVRSRLSGKYNISLKR